MGGAADSLRSHPLRRNAGKGRQSEGRALLVQLPSWPVRSMPGEQVGEETGLRLIPPPADDPPPMFRREPSSSALCEHSPELTW